VSYVALEFYGSSNAFFRKEFIGNVDVRDHFYAYWTNSINDTTTINVARSGSGFLNESRLNKQQIDLPSAFSSQTLDRIRFIDSGGVLISGIILQGLTVDVPDVSDITPTSLTLNTSQGGVDFSYRVSGADLSQDTTAALYWARGTSFADVIGGPVYDTPLSRPVGDHGPFYVPPAVLGTPPPGATHLLLAVDPPSPGLPNGHIAESDEDNNLLALSIGRADLVPAVDNVALHRLIYRGQTLIVPLTITNQGPGTADGNINIEYYLSTNQDTSLDGDTLLRTVTNHPINLDTSQSVPFATDVTIPNNPSVTIGTYYLKAKIIPGPTISETTLDNNIVVSEALRSCDDDDSMISQPVRAKRFEVAVAQAKASPGTLSHYFSDEDTKNYIKNNEEPGGFRPDPYFDQLRVPTIGWGFALMVRDSQGQLHERELARQRIESAQIEYQGEILTYERVLELTGTGATIQWFDEDYQTAKQSAQDLIPNFDQLTAQARMALIDLSYNLGSLTHFVRMRAAIEAGDLACAVFHMVDSLWATQVQFDRVIGNFRLLATGYESQL
jgi:GH24 family phage-related lysozyme (muramidase)